MNCPKIYRILRQNRPTPRYTAPGNEHLRRAEREANGFVRYTDVEKATVPEARTEPKILQSLAMDEINAIAGQFRA